MAPLGVLSLSCRPLLAQRELCCTPLNTGEFFDPTDLEEAVTPEAARQALSQHQYVKALLLALRLKDTDMLRHMMLLVPDQQVRPSRLAASSLSSFSKQLRCEGSQKCASLSARWALWLLQSLRQL